MYSVAAVLLLIPPAFVSTSQVRLALLFVVISAANATWIAAAYYASITYRLASGHSVGTAKRWAQVCCGVLELPQWD